MVRRWGAIAVFAVILMVFSTLPINVDCTDADGTKNSGLLIYELDPKDDSEGIAVMNYSSYSIDIGGYYFKNSNGKTYTFDSQYIPSGHTAAFIREVVDDDWFCVSTTTRTVTVCEDMKVTMKNTGDAIYLYNSSDKLVDAVCYGNYTASSGWSGIPVDLGYKEHVIRRVEPTDTDTYFDWAAVGDGYTAYSFAGTKTISADVTPFTFPECGGKQILASLKGATESVKISIYMLTSDYAASVLCDLENKGVEVQIMLENKPLGYDHDSGLLKTMADAGAEIKFIGGGTYDRYSYVHNKYAIIDGDEVIITSENWTTGNISKNGGNRGWGAIVYSETFADEMDSFFSNDWNFTDDLMDFSDKFPGAEATALPSVSEVNTYISSISYSPSTYHNVKASIYMSPDNTFKALQYLISNATERVYTEQMDLGDSYGTFETTSPLSSMIKAADRGVDARFMLSKSDDAAETVDKLNSTTNVKATTMGNSGYATMHNKGVIIDDTVWVSSVNWTENAFMNNRECGLYLQSAELAQFYLDAYMTDWNKNYKLSDTITVRPSSDGKTFTAKDCTGTCSWKAFDDNGNVLSEYSGDTFVLQSLEGVGHIKVTDSNGSTGRYVISSSVEPEPTPDPEPAAPSEDSASEKTPLLGGAAVAIVIVLLIILKVIRGKR